MPQFVRIHRSTRVSRVLPTTEQLVHSLWVLSRLLRLSSSSLSSSLCRDNSEIPSDIYTLTSLWKCADKWLSISTSLHTAHYVKFETPSRSLKLCIVCLRVLPYISATCIYTKVLAISLHSVNTSMILKLLWCENITLSHILSWLSYSPRSRITQYIVANNIDHASSTSQVSARIYT